MHPVLVCSKGCGVAEGHGLFLLFVDVANRMQNLFVFALLVISATLAADVVSVADGVDQQQKMLVCIVDRVDDSADETPVVSYGQQIAQMRANYMASRNFRGHPPKSAGNQWSIAGANFEGVGWNSSQTIAPNRIGTCRPSGRSGSADDNSRRLLGDAVSTSRYGSFRVRIWGR